MLLFFCFSEPLGGLVRKEEIEPLILGHKGSLIGKSNNFCSAKATFLRCTSAPYVCVLCLCDAKASLL